jgi:transposase-like protein
MTEDDAFWKFVEMRWGSKEIAICPHCGVIDKHYFRSTRKQWRCKHCDGYFSVITKTSFENTKLSFKKILLGMMEFISAHYGISTHQLSSRMDVQVKTAHVFVGRIREIIYRDQPTIQLSGMVQIDGGHFGGRPRHGRVRRKHAPDDVAAHTEWMLTRKGKRPSTQPPSTGKANWLRRLKNRRVVMVLRELYPTPGSGASKTIVAISNTENEKTAVAMVKKYVRPGTVIMSDENKAYASFNDLGYIHKTVEHAVEFSTIDGINDNQAESYFSRLRHYALSIGKRIQPKYLADIASEMAWREDVRRNTLGEKLIMLFNGLCRHGISKWWTGYWQGHHRQDERMFSTIP